MKRFIILLALLPYFVVGHTTTVKSGENITISTPVEGDLYIAGNDLTIEAVINGDIIGAGADIFIRDTIKEDASFYSFSDFIVRPFNCLINLGL